MDYIIPDNIKSLCNQDDLSSSKEQERVKRELVKFLTAYLTLGDENDNTIGRNSLANITDIVSKDGEFPIRGAFDNYPFQRDVAGRMMRTRNYTLKEGKNDAGKKEVYVIAADRDWWDRKKFLALIITLIVGTIIGSLGQPLSNLIDGIIKQKADNIEEYRVKLKADKPILHQTDSVYILQILKKDSAK